MNQEEINQFKKHFEELGGTVHLDGDVSVTYEVEGYETPYMPVTANSRVFNNAQELAKFTYRFITDEDFQERIYQFHHEVLGRLGLDRPDSPKKEQRLQFRRFVYGLEDEIIPFYWNETLSQDDLMILKNSDDAYNAYCVRGIWRCTCCYRVHVVDSLLYIDCPDLLVINSDVHNKSHLSFRCDCSGSRHRLMERISRSVT